MITVIDGEALDCYRREHVHGGHERGVNGVNELAAHAADHLEQLALVDTVEHGIGHVIAVAHDVLGHERLPVLHHALERHHAERGRPVHRFITNACVKSAMITSNLGEVRHDVAHHDQAAHKPFDASLLDREVVTTRNAVGVPADEAERHGDGFQLGRLVGTLGALPRHRAVTGLAAEPVLQARIPG